MKKFCVTGLLTVVVIVRLNAFSSDIDSGYLNSLRHLAAMLNGQEELSFKKAVFITENTYESNRLSYDEFESGIQYLAKLSYGWRSANPCSGYRYTDSLNLCNNISIYKILKDTVSIVISKRQIVRLIPFSYNFSDFDGKKNWESIFVITLLKTHLGNCRSLPYLYKILADEIGAKCWLSFAPSHIYIKNYCSEIGWYNTELTSGQFPLDAWIMASGYVPTDAIRSGIYMDTLSNQQAVANCVLDLAKGYERKFKIYTDSFIVKCCDLTLKYHPNNINAIIYKAETLKKMYLLYLKEKPSLAASVYSDMEKLYLQALDLGYKEMPEKMYQEWLFSVSKQKNKYSNKKVSNTIK